MLLAPTAEEVYMDLGAYNGDTIQELGRLTDWQWREVLAVERIAVTAASCVCWQMS